MHRRGRLAALAALTGVWLLATGPAAAAHGALVSSDPAGGSSLERAKASPPTTSPTPPTWPASWTA